MTKPSPLKWFKTSPAGLPGGGCNFEKGDRYSQARRHEHQAVFWGFLLCLASTSSGTVLHYVFDQPAPYGFFSLPKLLGVPRGHSSSPARRC